jgi:hypothetical protein
MDVDIDLQETNDDNHVEEDGSQITPMPTSGGIESLREKLHARMAALRRGGINTNGAEPHDRDELLEERRRQRAAMRERRRKETKEKIRRAEEMKGKKGKEKDKGGNRDKSNLAKVWTLALVMLCTNKEMSSDATNSPRRSSRSKTTPRTSIVLDKRVFLCYSRVVIHERTTTENDC